MKNIAIILSLTIVLTACSTAGGLYKSDDPEHGEFSTNKTIMGILGIIGGAIIIKNSNNGAEDYNEIYWYDYTDD